MSELIEFNSKRHTHKLRGLRSLLVLILCFSVGVGVINGQADVQAEIHEAYNALADASSRGGDVSELVSQLDSIILEVETGNYDSTEVLTSVGGIINEANSIAETASVNNNIGLVWSGANLIVLVVLGYVVWRYFPTYYWRAWLKLRGHWIVE